MLATSSTPRAAPCVFALPASADPKPIVVRMLIKVGLSLDRAAIRALTMAGYHESKRIQGDTCERTGNI
jgi:hypothetical protein